MEVSTVVTLVITNIFVGLGVGLGFWLVSRSFLKDLTKNIPGWIHEVVKESRKSKAIEDALEARKGYQ